MQNKFKKYLPHFISLLIFLIISVIYFQPLFEGKVIRQGDIINYKGFSKEINDYREKYGEEPLWTNSLFGGMPAYQISVKYKGNLIQFIDKALQLWLPFPAGLLFLMLLGFFILMLVLDIDPWIAFAGALAFAFSSYFFIILEAGHNSKAHAIAYMAPVLAGIILCFKQKYILGGALSALFISLEIATNHLQITYYLLIAVIIFIVVEGVYAIREKQIKNYLKALGVLSIASILAVLPNMNNLLVTYDYSKYTTRGKSELTFDLKNKTSGLDKDYATQWSYGKAETFSLMIPNIKGGASDLLINNKKAIATIEPKYRRALYEAQINQYWGDQPFTSGAVYTGAFVVFLFILGLFIVKGKYKWFLLIATIISILLAWGKNFMWLSDIFLDYFPGYNKFRAVSMILVIAELSIPILAVITLYEIYKKPTIIKENKKWFFISLALTAGLALLFWLMPTTFFSFFSAKELEEFSKQAGQKGLDEFLNIIETARIAVFKADVIRSFLFIIIGAGLIYLWSFFKLHKTVFLLALPVIFAADLIPVTNRYLNKDNYVNKKIIDNPFPISKADEIILNDKEAYFRVYNMTVNTFNDASTSYYHKSVGGYHGAKLKKYQEFIDYVLIPEITTFYSVIKNNPTDSSLKAALYNMKGFNMLNTKYIIYNKDAPPLLNPYALGNAWFINNIKIVPDANTEITEVANIDPSNTVVVDKRYEHLFVNKDIKRDTNAKIMLISYKPNCLEYKVENLKHTHLAVFSDIFYPNGWNAYLDGQIVPHFRVNYLFRAMIMPPGNHSVIFKFEPKIFYIGERISLVGSILLYLTLLTTLYWQIRRKRKKC